MSRKPPNDSFTRFTSTSPTSSSSPSFISDSTSSSSPSNPSAAETAAQRVARLRAEHLQRRAAELSTTDRVLAHGRRWADIAHRITTYSLLGFSFLAAVGAAYGFVSLVNHNRTQKRAWIERELDRLEAARAAFLKGEADAEQLHLLEQERAGEEIRKKYEADKKRRKEEGWVASVKNMFQGSGSRGAESGELTMRERAAALQEAELVEAEVARGQQAQPQTRRFRMGNAEVELRPAAVQETAISGVGLDEKGRPVPISKMETVPVQGRSVGEAVRPQQQRRGGQLDMLAENITTDAKTTSSNWWNSVFGGSKAQ